jgi:hypothetical protein
MSYRFLVPTLVAFVLSLVVHGGLSLAECTNYENYLHWLNSIQFPENAPRGVFADEDFAYITQNQTPGDLLIYDISLAGNAAQVGSMSLPKRCCGVHAGVDLAVLVSEQVDTTATFFTVDISDRSAPVMLGSVITGRRYTEVAMDGGYAYALCTDGFFDVFDVTDPANPSLHQSLVAPTDMYRMEIRDGLAYVVAMTNGFLIFDISTPGSAYLRGQYTWVDDSWRLTDLALDTDRAICGATHSGSSNCGIWTINITDPSSPYRQNAWGTSYPPPHNLNLATAGGIVYYGASTGYIYYFNLYAHPSNHHIFETDGLLGGNIQDLQIFAGDLYIQRAESVHYDGWVHMISVASPSPGQPLGSVPTPGQAYAVVEDLGAKDPILYVADGAAGVTILDATDPANPTILNTVDTPGNAVDIYVESGLAYVADSGAGLQVLNVSSPASASIIGTYDTEGTAVKLDVVGSLAYLADTDWGLQIIDVSTPVAPFRRSNLAITNSAVDVTVNGGLAYVAADLEGLVICDVSDPDNPWIIDDVKGGGGKNITATKVDFARDKVYVADGSDGMLVVDVADPNNAAVLGDVEVESIGQDVQVAGIFSYVCNSSGVNVVDCRDGANMSIVGNLGVPATSRGIHLTEFYAYVANGDGIQVCPSQCGYDETAEAYFTPSIENGWLPDVEVTFTNESVGYGLSYHWDFGDGVGSSTETNPTYTYTEPGDFLVTLTATNGVNVGYYSSRIGALIEEPTITSVTDVPDDQGGWVYVRFHRSGHDADQLNKAELYTVQRRDAGQWVSAAITGAYGEGYYTVVTPTQVDGDSLNTTDFRVIANMDEGNWASEVVTGFSEDNIAPAAPTGLMWTGSDALAWDEAEEDDFAYYQVFGSTEPDFVSAVKVGVTVSNGFTVPIHEYGWFFVTAVDDYGLHSEPAGTQNVSAVPDAAMATRLFAPVPNPFNPSTTLRFSLAEVGPVQLMVYDISGRKVRTLLAEVLPGGEHTVVWNGQDDLGRAVAAGTYFCRMQTVKTTVTQRMALVK